MTSEEQAFLLILKEEIHPCEGISYLPTSNFEAVLNIARKQNMFSLIYDALAKCPDFSEVNEANPQYFSIIAASVLSQVQKTNTFIELYKKFMAKGLYPIVVKGIVCRSLYGDKDAFRPSGDEDIIIEKKDYGKAVEILNECGYHSIDQPDKGLNTIQEVTFQSSFNEGRQNLTIELHLNPFGTNSLMKNKMNSWFRDIFQSDESVIIQDTPIRTLTPTDHFLFLVFHAFKHFTAGGFGIRLMLDVLMYAEKYGDRIDWDYISKGLEDVGAARFFADLLNIGNTYLGFSLKEQNQTVCPESLLEDMFQMGTFGNTTRNGRTAGIITEDAVRRADQQKNKQRNKIEFYYRMIFPSWETWIGWKPYLADKPLMLPIEWAKRISRYIRGETSSRNLNEIDESYRISSARVELLKKYSVL